MMPIAHLLQDFGTVFTPGEAVSMLSDAALEEERLTSFEQGYTAGWDDSLKSQADEKHRITDVLSKNLEDLSFTYEEAYSQMVQSVVPVFDAMVDQVLPSVMKETIGAKIAEQVRELVGDQTKYPVRLCVSQGYGGIVRPAVGNATSMPVSVFEDSSLAEGQAFLQIGDQECELDPMGMVENIRDAIQAFSFELTAEAAHG